MLRSKPRFWQVESKRAFDGESGSSVEGDTKVSIGPLTNVDALFYSIAPTPLALVD